MPIILGIDPGQGGSIVMLHADGSYLGHKRLDETEADIWAWLEDPPAPVAHAFLEKVHSSPQMGVTSAFTFGKGLGFLLGVLTASRIAFDIVRPQEWQKAMSCLTKGEKNISKAAAQRLFPAVKVTHANADALLIAEYGRRIVNARNGVRS